MVMQVTGSLRRWESRSLNWLLTITIIMVPLGLRYVAGVAEWASEYPDGWEVPLNSWARTGMDYLVNRLDLGFFTFKDLTRFFSGLLEQPFLVAEGLLAKGFNVNDNGYNVQHFPAISWIGILAASVLVAFVLGGWKLAATVGFGLVYLAMFGLWESAMITVALMVVAVPFGVLGGLGLGVIAFRNRHFEITIAPILDLMQTMPIFAYLVPVLFLFGFGPIAALTATIVYAMPPMVRVTTLALKQVPPEVIEYGRMSGCTRSQLLWKVLMPSARPTLMVGVNQVIMLSLTVVIVGSMIGAGGLGFDVLNALRQLSIGKGLEAGLAITFLAIMLDRVSQAYAEKFNRTSHKRQRGSARFGLLFVIVAFIAISTFLSMSIEFFERYPKRIQITTAPFWDDVVTWTNINLYNLISSVKYFILKYMLIPVKYILLSLPWISVVGLIALTGYQLGGTKLAFLTGGLTLFLAISGNWDKSMITIYLCGVSVIIATALGMPIGLIVARNSRVRRITHVVIDTLQTLPSFVYLIPAVMLFQNGDFAALIAIVAYGIVPAIRYTDHGIRMISPELIEAAQSCGCTRLQILRKVELPLALPEIMLGINQTIMMSLSMLIITALVGTRDLGQEVLNALQLADPGRGLVAGLCVAFIAIVADRLIVAGSERMRQQVLVV